MKNICFFVHVPKTAGTSFRNALASNKKLHMLYDYGKGSPNSTPELVNINPKDLTVENNIFAKENTVFICGHVNYSQYAHCVSPDAVITIIRNPIERIVSEYQHKKRLSGLKSSFIEYIDSPTHKDKQGRILKSLDLEKKVCIGITSHYKYFVEMFSERFNIPIPAMSANQAPSSDKEERFKFSVGEIKYAYLYNKKDIEFFFRCVLRFEKSMRAIGYNTIPLIDTKWNCRIDAEGRVIGWIASDHNDCYFVAISVNGQDRVVIAADQIRQDIYNSQLSKIPECGFSYPISLLGIEKGDEVKVSILGSLKHRKKMIFEG